MKIIIVVFSLFFVCGTGDDKSCTVVVQDSAPDAKDGKVVVEDTRTWSGWVLRGLVEFSSQGKVIRPGKHIYVNGRDWGI